MSGAPKPLWLRIYNFFSGYTLAVILLSLLLVLTYLGTMAQVEMGLYDASEKYFESFFLQEKIGPVPIILPGVYLVSVLLFVNLLLGAIIRARKSWKRPGMLIAHGGILYILFSGFVTFHFTEEGSMLLYEGDRADEIYNLTDWSIEVARHDAEGKREGVYVIGEEDLKPLWKKGARRTFFAKAMPFEFEIYSYARNITNSQGQLTGLPTKEAVDKEKKDIENLRKLAKRRLNLPADASFAELDAVVLPESLMPYIDESDSDTLDLIKELKDLGPDRRESGMGYGDLMAMVEWVKELDPKKYNEKSDYFSRIKQAWADEGELWKRVANGDLLVSRYAGHGEFIEGPYEQLNSDDLAILPRKESKTREANQPATYIKVKKASGKVLVHSILVGANPFAPRPLTVEVDGETWSIDLTRSRYSLPFGIELEKFEKEDHPGTARAREYSSDVFRLDGGMTHLVKKREGAEYFLKTPQQNESNSSAKDRRGLMGDTPSGIFPQGTKVKIAGGEFLQDDGTGYLKVETESGISAYISKSKERVKIQGTDKSHYTSAELGVIPGTDKYHISMNKPMRYAGYTLYQASWGPPGAKQREVILLPDGTEVEIVKGDRLYTSLAVSRNPADQWPKYGTYVISLGMVIHFLQKLFAYLRRSSRARQKKEVKP